MNGGTTTFVDRLAAVLGIHVSSIKVVGVYEGSLVVDYNIYQTQTGGSAQNGTFLQDVQRRQLEVISLAGSDPNIPNDWLGAPVLDFSIPSSNMTVLSDGVLSVEAFVALTGQPASEYDPAKYVITSTSTNAGGVSTRVVEPDYIHVDTTVVFQPEAEIRPDFVPGSNIRIVDEYDQELQKKANEAARQIEREQAQSGTTKSIILAAVIVIALGIFLVVVKMISNYTKLRQIDMNAMEKIRQKQLNDSEMKQFAAGGDGDTLNYTSEDKLAQVNEYQTQFDPLENMRKTAAEGFAFGALEPGCDVSQEVMESKFPESSPGQEWFEKEPDSRPNSKPTSGNANSRKVLAEDQELEDDE